MNMNSTEVQELLLRIKEEQKNSGEKCDIIPFKDFWDKKYSANDTAFSEPSFLSEVGHLADNNQLTYYQELTSYRSGASGLVKPVKRVIRKVVAFLFLPLVSAQNAVNKTVANLFTNLRCYVNRERIEREQLEERVHELELRLDMQKAQIDELTRLTMELSKGKGENK